MRYWPKSELFEATNDGRFRRLFVEEERIRSATLSFAVGDSVEEHSHPGSAEIFYVVSGSGRISVEDEIFEMNLGDFLFIAAGERHALLAVDSPEGPFVIAAFVAPHLGDDAVFSDRPLLF
jgi:quercetin dioxygenase-like cupin family protein